MQTFIDSLLERLLATSVQTLLLVALVWLLCRCLPRLAPATQCWLWWLVALQVLVGLCVDPLPLRLLPAAPVAAAVLTSMAEPELLVADGAAAVASAAAWTWQTGVFLLWVAGCAVMGGLMLRDWRRIRTLLKEAVDCTDERLLQAIADTAAARGLRGAPRLAMSDRIESPMVIGHLRPVLLLPANAALSAGELDMAVAHELEHLRRADLWWGFIPGIARHCLFFHPLMHLAAREYDIAREAACDAAVVAADDGSRRDYGELLLRLGTARGVGAGLAAASPTFLALRRRLTLLQHTSFLPRAGSIAVVLLVLAFVLPWRLVEAASPVATPAAAAAPAAPVVLPQVSITAPTNEAPPPATPRVDRKAQVIFRPDIEALYPAESRALGEEGTPRLRLCFDDTGKVVDVTLTDPSQIPRLDEAALRAGQSFRFLPAIIDGQPTGQCMIQPIRFSTTPRPVQTVAPPVQAGGTANLQPGAATTQKAQVIYRPDIRDFYPAVSRSLGEEGTSRVRICIEEAGRITEATVVESSGFARLDEAAVMYSRRLRFKPAINDGVPVPQCFVQPVKFSKVQEVAGIQQTGEGRMSVVYQDIPVRMLLQQLSGVSGKTFIVDDSVTGSVTLRLENVSWQQVLDIVLRTKQLEQRAQGNEIVIAAAGVLSSAR